MTDDNPKLGIILVVTGLCIAAFTGALMKKLSVDLTAYQITWFRYLGFVVILFPIVAIRFGSQALKPARPWMQGVRGLTMATGTVAFVIGARTIDFADAISILYAYPFLLTVLAVLFLKEKVGWQGWVGVVGGFLGVLLVIRPEFGKISGRQFVCIRIRRYRQCSNGPQSQTGGDISSFGHLDLGRCDCHIFAFHYCSVSLESGRI